MTSTRAKDFLVKELFIKKNVVTFRLLSRELCIHVNDAKNELAAYLAETANTDTPSFATYMVSGLAPTSSNCDDQHVMRSKIILVDNDGLQDAKLRFSRINSVHIYSLSPSVFREPHLICEPTTSVRDMDTKGNPILNGKIIGAHVKAKKGPLINTSTTSSSNTTLGVQKQVVSQSSSLPRQMEQVTDKVKPNERLKEKDQAKPSVEIKELTKPSGKLNWSKAKNAQETTEAKDRTKPWANLETQASSSSAKRPDEPSRNRYFGPQSKKSMPKSVALQSKRPPKRKSSDPSDSDADIEDQPPLKDRKTNPLGTRKAGVVMSDDEEEVPRKPRRKNSTARSFEAMMDIDDDQVIRKSRLSSHRPEDSMDDTADEIGFTDDIPISSAGEGEEEDEEDYKPQVKKRKPKKVIPVGRNGLKKRRVMKSRATTDAKGYIQTEDYSSYESVSEEEGALGDTRESKGKKKAGTALKSGVGAEKVETNVKVKETKTKANTRKLPNRGSLLNFFGPDKTKK